MASIRRQANQQFYTKVTARNYDERQVNIVKNIHTMKEKNEQRTSVELRSQSAKRFELPSLVNSNQNIRDLQPHSSLTKLKWTRQVHSREANRVNLNFKNL